MKKLLHVAVLTLAANFIFAAAGFGYLVVGGRLNRENLRTIRSILSRVPDAGSGTDSVHPDVIEEPPLPADPAESLRAFLASAAGRDVIDPVGARQQWFDARLAVLDRIARQQADRERTIDLAMRRVILEREAVESDRRRFADERDAAERRLTDAGFRRTLGIVSTLPPRQARAVLEAYDDETIVQYLEAMDERTVGRIVKEFKTPAEAERLRAILGVMRERRPKRDGVLDAANLPVAVTPDGSVFP